MISQTILTAVSLIFLLSIGVACSKKDVHFPKPTSRDSQEIRGISKNLQANKIQSVADLVEKVQPSVVSISVDILSKGLFRKYTNESSGTGMIISPNGYIVTNHHVIVDASDIEVSLLDGRTFPARIIGKDSLTDLAILKVAVDDLPAIIFGNSTVLRPGDQVITIGNALNLKGGPSVTMGIISGLGRTVETDRGDLYDMIQTDAAINRGNSGGPLLNMNGDVIGINTAVYGGAQSMGFAISASIAQPIFKSLIEYGKVVRPLMGLRGTDVTQTLAHKYKLGVTEGVLVTYTSENGPAYRSGLRSGDVITAINSDKTKDMADFLTTLWSHKVGDKVKVAYISEQSQNVTEVTLIERPSDS